MNNRIQWQLVFCAILINCLGLCTPVFDGDSALYASISKTMADSGNFYTLTTINTGAWLDKPHFPFWCWALCIKIWGNSAWAFKLPSLFFYCIGLGYTYLFSKKYYGSIVGYLSVLILSTALHTNISNTDVRAEFFYTPMIIATVYHFSFLYNSVNVKHLSLGILWCATAILSKGIFVTIPVFAAIFGEYVLNKNIKGIFHLKWIIVTIAVTILTIPELICLALQFGNTKHIIVNGTTIDSYIKFFFWDSQFGRFLNSGPFKGTSSFFYYGHTLLWALFPWSIFFLKSLFKIKPLKEFYSISAFVVTFIIFSLSKFQLSHHIILLFPFISIIIGRVTFEWLNTNNAPISLLRIQAMCIALFFVALTAFTYYFEPVRYWYCITIIMLFMLLELVIYFGRSSPIQKCLLSSGLVGLLCSIYLGLFFYPTILKYMAGKSAAEECNKLSSKYKVCVYGISPHLFHYYLNTQPAYYRSIDNILENMPEHFVLYTTKEYLPELLSKNVSYTLLSKLLNYRITQLSPTFLNKNTRDSACSTHYLILVNNTHSKLHLQ